MNYKYRKNKVKGTYVITVIVLKAYVQTHYEQIERNCRSGEGICNVPSQKIGSLRSRNYISFDHKAKQLVINNGN